MLPADDLERVTNISEMLIELYTLRAAACGPEDWHRVRRLEEEVHRSCGDEPSLIGRTGA
jgi:hypothetical protein